MTSSNRSRKIRFALILGGLSAFAPLSIDMYLPAFPAMTEQLGAGQSQVQLTLTAFVISLALGQAIAGPLSDAFGRKIPLVVGLVLYAVASVACAFSPSAYALIGFRFLEGLGAAAGIVIARAQVRDMYSGVAMARFFSSLMLVNGLGPILAPVLGAQILRFTSWRGVFLVLAIVGVILLLAVLLGIPETLPAERRQPARIGSVLRSYRRLLADRAFLGYALTGAFLFASLFAYISGSPFVLQDIYGLSPQLYSLVFGLNSVGIMITGQLSGWLVSRFSSRSLVAAGLVMAMVGGVGLLAVVLAGLGLVAILPPLFVLVSSIGIVLPNATTLGLADQAANAGAASALIGVTQFLIGGIAGPLAGTAGNSALPMAILMAACALLATLSYVIMTRPSRHQPDRQDDDHHTGAQSRDQSAARAGEHAPN